MDKIIYNNQPHRNLLHTTITAVSRRAKRVKSCVYPSAGNLIIYNQRSQRLIQIIFSLLLWPSFSQRHATIHDDDERAERFIDRQFLWFFPTFTQSAPTTRTHPLLPFHISYIMRRDFFIIFTYLYWVLMRSTPSSHIIKYVFK